jgi:hypothetical protein
MACSLTLQGRALPCRDSVGGVRNVWILTNYNSVADGQFVDGMYGAISSGNINSATQLSIFKDYLSPRNVSTFTQNVSASAENGIVFYTQVLSLVLAKPVAADLIELRNLRKGRLAIIVEDNNGRKFVMGHTQGSELSGGSLATGTAKGDLNGYTLEFTAEEQIPAPFVGTGTNMTFTPTA